MVLKTFFKLIESSEIPSVLEMHLIALENKCINFIYLETGLNLRFKSIETTSKLLRPYNHLPNAIYKQTVHWIGKQN